MGAGRVCGVIPAVATKNIVPIDSVDFLVKVVVGPGIRTIALPILPTLLDLFQSRALLHLEILALRQQLPMVNQAPVLPEHSNHTLLSRQPFIS